MAIGRVSGAMLSSNLDRQGAPLNFVSGLATLVHMDFTGSMVGINTDNVTETLTVNGTIGTANSSDVNGMTIDGSTISAKNNGTLTIGSEIDLGNLSTVYIQGGSDSEVIFTDGYGNLSWGNITTMLYNENFLQNVTINGATISTNVPNGDLVITGLGSGQVTSPAMSVVTLHADNFTSTNMDGTLTGEFYGNAYGTFTGIVNTPAQPLITSVGILTSLDVAGNINAPAINSTLHGDVYTNNIYDIDGNLTITTRPDAVLTINSTSAAVLPNGTTFQRPITVAGAIRYNADSKCPEFYDGTKWVSMMSTVSSQLIYGNGSADRFPLAHSATADGIIVSINGTVQQPGISYSVEPTIYGDYIVFQVAPRGDGTASATTDEIDIRFLTTTPMIEIATQNAITVNSTAMPYGTSPVVMDQFLLTSYSGAKYTVSGVAADGTTIMSDVMVTHDGVTATIGNTSVGTANVATYTAVVAGGNVQVLVSTVASGASLKLFKLYFPV